MEEKVNQNQNVDAVLSTVSDEYLRKKKRNKKITLSVILFFVLALSVVIITLACVKTNLKPYFLSEPSNIEVYIGGTRQYSTAPTDENYEQFYDIYQKSFSSNILTALFTGKLGSYEVYESDSLESFYSSSSSKTGMSDTLKEYLGDNYVHLQYGQDQQLYNADGSVYYSTRWSNRYNMQYKDVYFNITDTDADHELTFYFGAYYKGDDGKDYSPHIISITIRANTFQLYDYVTAE